MKNILIIEDEEDILELLQYNLENAGYAVKGVTHGGKGLVAAQANPPNIIILDIMLPGLNGLEICRRLKSDSSTSAIPIIMVSARGEESDIIKGLDLGADDYITKPFSPKILVARVNALFRRNRHDAINEDIIQIEGITIHFQQRTIQIDGTFTDLTFSEFQILSLLASHPGWVYTRNQIIKHIHGDNYPVTDRSIDFQIVGLRKKMLTKGNLVQTVRGVGYKFKHEKF
ncbi:MAG: response regulator transcription factor [Candidatus Marinimicrobia bacterium]|nr:response regulator transcription factor [Candidatus Neomarinimicrobiota bacterium]